jgi:hypothetical protein
MSVGSEELPGSGSGRRASLWGLRARSPEVCSLPPRFDSVVTLSPRQWMHAGLRNPLTRFDPWRGD